MKIRPPIKGEGTVPKVVCSFTHGLLELAFFEALEEAEFSVILEPEVWTRSGIRSKFDILLPEQNIVFEVENFWESFSNMSRHSRRLESRFGLRTYIVTWKARHLLPDHLEGDWKMIAEERLVTVDPLTGRIEGPHHFLEPAPPPPEDITYEIAPPGSDEVHGRMLYELFKYLTLDGKSVGAEIPISPEKAYTFDKVHLSRAEGIIDWSPPKPHPYAVRGLPPWASIDITSASQGGELEAYEVKSRRELKALDPSRLLKQLEAMLHSRLFNRAWICLPAQFAGMMADNILSVSDPIDRSLGVLGLTGPHSFQVFKKAELLPDPTREFTSILID